jgi:flagellar FliJ protein
MARFNFRLQQFLGIKEKIEDQKEIEYSQALRQLEDERRKKRLLVMELNAQIRTFKQSLQEVINPVDIRRYNNNIERINMRIIEQDERIKAAEAYAETKRLELVQAMKERKMLESVRERRLDEYTRSEMIAEQKITDGLVSYKYAERQRSNRG